MPELRLDDGMVIAFPADATPAEVVELIVAYYSVAETPTQAPEAPQVTKGPETALRPSNGLPAPSETPSDPSGPTIVTVGPGIGLEFGQYQRQDHIDRDEQTVQLIEQLQQRGGKSDPRHSVHDVPRPTTQEGTIFARCGPGAD